jgi:hypothetical protein
MFRTCRCSLLACKGIASKASLLPKRTLICRRKEPVFALRASTGWWAVTDSNRRHPACKAGALPTELTALATSFIAAADGEASAGGSGRGNQVEAGLVVSLAGSFADLGAWKPAAADSFSHI